MSNIPSGNRRTFLHDSGMIFSKCKESWGDIDCAYHDDSVDVVGDDDDDDDGLLSPSESPKPPQNLR